MRLLFTLCLFTVFTLSSCGGDKKPSEDPSKGASGNVPTGTKESASQEPGAIEKRAPGAGSAEAFERAENTGAAENTPPGDEAKAALKSPESAVAPESPTNRLRPSALPKPNSDGFFMVIQRASTSCRDNDTTCEPVRQLAARIPGSLEEIIALAKKGTDQQKQAIRKALLMTDHEPAVPLMLTYAITPLGQLDMPIVEHLVTLRADGLTSVLRKYLKKAVGTDARAAIRALGRLGTPTATQAVKDALKMPNLAPYLGDVCQALARLGAADTLETVKALGSRLDGSRRQAEGCRNAEAALRMLSLPSPVTLFLDRKQHRRLSLTAEQRAPRQLTLMFTDAPNATCDNRGTIIAEIDVPLDWNGEPIIGKPVVPSVRVGADTLDSTTAYFARLDTLELISGNPISGIGFFSYVPVKGSHRLVMQGTFAGTYCGAAKPR